MRKILIIHGPNLNLLGEREPEIYGNETLEQINEYIAQRALEYGIEVMFFQSNHEGALIDRLHAARREVDGVVLNPAALSHYSIALRDAVSSISVPVIEVHLSDISKREPFRRESVVAPACFFQISGYGKESYVYGIEALLGSEVVQQYAQEIRKGGEGDALLRRAVELLHHRFPKYDWTGIYLVKSNELVLHNYIGAPSPHTRIPIGKGICGAAVADRETIIVPNVNEDSRYLACSVETRSEIVVPIYRGETILGEIDIDSHTPDAFKEHDRWYLEKMAALIGKII